MLSVRRYGMLMAVFAVVTFLTPVGADAAALTGQRVALVIGNAVYEHAPSLANPLNDATDIGVALERLGFAVTRLENVSQVSLRRGLQEFKRAASVAEIATVFYAGHGIEVNQKNFLIPVDARLVSDQEIEFEAVPLHLVMHAVEGASLLRLVILDACRNNPFVASMQRSGATRSIGRGLARVEPSGETLIAFAAKEGTLASDGEDRNSPYSRALLRHLEEPGLEVGLMFRKVREAVMISTGGRQEPFVYGSLSSKGIYFSTLPTSVPMSSSEVFPATENGTVSERLSAEHLAAKRLAGEEELLFWESVKDSKDVPEIQAYLDRYPDGKFEILARNRLKRLTDLQEETAHHMAAISTVPTNETSPDSSPLPPVSEMVERALNLEREDRRLLQIGLAALGFDPGPADGVFGHGTRGAIRKWQTSRFAKTTGYLNVDEVKILFAAAKTAPHPKPRKNLLQDALKTISMALTVANRIEDTGDRSSAFNIIAIAQEKVGDVRGAERTFMKSLAATERIVKDWQRNFSFGKIAGAQVRAGMLQEALTTAERIEDPEDQVNAFVLIAKAQEMAGDAQGAVKLIARSFAIAERSGDVDTRDHIYLDIAIVQAEVGKFRNALSTAERMKDSWTKYFAFINIAEEQVNGGDFRGAEKSNSRAMVAAEGIESDFDKFKSQAFASIARIESKVGNAQNTAKFFSKAGAVAKLLENSWGVRDAVFGAIVREQAAVGYFRDALETTRRIENIAGRSSAFADIAIAQAQAGMAQDAVKSFSEALAIAETLTDDERSNTFGYIAAKQAHAGNVEDALSTVKKIKDDNIRVFNYDYAFLEIVRAQAKAGRFRVALANTKKILNENQYIYSLISVAQAQVEAVTTLQSTN